VAISTNGLLRLAAEQCESIKASGETIENICLVITTSVGELSALDAQTARITRNKRTPF
jgi:hypothetical protein